MKILGTAATIFTTKADLQAAVRAYDANSTDAIATYGAIAGWDVSRIADISELFLGLHFFNADISNWNTSSVTSMRAMFEFASVFNQPLSFDVQRHATTGGMFRVHFARALTPQPSDVPIRRAYSQGLYAGAAAGGAVAVLLLVAGGAAVFWQQKCCTSRRAVVGLAAQSEASGTCPTHTRKRDHGAQMLAGAEDEPAPFDGGAVADSVVPRLARDSHRTWRALAYT